MKTVSHLHQFLCFITLMAFALSSITAQTTIPMDIRNTFIASGYMGCGFKYVKSMHDISREDSSASQITFIPCNPMWGGLFWQQPPNDWECKKKGIDLSKKGFTKITFWVKGAVGGEEIKFRAGMDCDSTYQTEEEIITLTKNWEKHVVDLIGKNLSNVHGAFCFVVAADTNPNGKIIFYFDDLQFE